MKFMYMDESGKNLISDPHQTVFIYGGLIIDHQNVEKALTDFKVIFQEARTYLKEEMRNNFEGNPAEKTEAMHKVFNKFEFHAVEIFNRRHKTKGNGEVKRYNPWKYAQPSTTFSLVRRLIEAIHPYISDVFIYKVDKSKLTTYFQATNTTPHDDFVHDEMIRFVINEYDQWLKQYDKQGALLPDKLDPDIRERFVQEINTYNSQAFWSEPIIVESYTNAFTQMIDVITYCYYLVYTNASNKPNFSSIQRLFYDKINKFITVKDLGDELNSQIKNTP